MRVETPVGNLALLASGGPVVTPDGRKLGAVVVNADLTAFRDALTNDAAVPAPPVQRAPEAPRPNPAPRPDAAAWPAQPPAVHRAVRDIAPRPHNPTAPPAAPAWFATGAPPGNPSMPPIPPWMPASWRDARKQMRAYNKDQRRAMREHIREQRRALARGETLPPGFEAGQEVPIEYKIRSFRMHVARVGTSAAVLAGINFFTSPFVPWFLVPAAFMSLSVLRRGGSLWAEGVRMRDIFGKEARLPAPGARPTIPYRGGGGGPKRAEP